MKKKRFRPYEIDMDYEQRTHKFVGRDYGNSKSANLGLVPNTLRFFRKLRNRNQEKYAFCNTYTDWESHVKKIVKKDIININDFIHWLYRKRNVEKQILETVKTVFIPLYLAAFTVPYLYKIEANSYGSVSTVGSIIIIYIFVFFICFRLLHDAYEKVNFYNDFICVAERELMNK